MLSVPRAAVDIPAWEGPRGLKHSHDLSCDEDKLLEVLKARVFGVGVDRVPRAMKESARRVGQSQEGVVAPG